MNTLLASSFSLPGQQSKYIGKVREVISLENDLLVMIATDKLSAFDVVMPKGIPYKGQILNQIATHMMDATKDIVPNWLEATPCKKFHGDKTPLQFSEKHIHNLD